MFLPSRGAIPVLVSIAVLTALTVGTVQSGGTVTIRAAATTVNAVRTTITLGGGLSVTGASGVALNPSTGLFYIGLTGTIVGGCTGESNLTQGPGANQMSIVDAAQSRELAAVPTGGSPIWPTVDPDRQVVYMANSGTGTVTRHDESTGALLGTIRVGGKPHYGGLDYSTRLMLVSNTVRGSTAIADQNHASVVNTATDTIVREFEIGPGAHGMAVDQERNLAYASSVGNGAITVVDLATGLTLFSAIPNSIYGTAFGNNNMIARQAATRRLFQVNSQQSALGIIVVDEVTLAAERLIQFAGFGPAWGLWVDEPNRLLFAAFPGANAIGVADLDTLTHVATIPVGQCPYSVAVDPARLVGVAVNQGSPTVNATASLFDLCPVYSAVGRTVSGCSTTPTSGPSNLLGLADGDNLTLAWKNTGAATTLTLNVSGAYAGSLPLTSSAELFQYSNVPSGTYAFTIVGATASSNTVSLTFPGTCSAPQTPANFSVANNGRTITASWDLPASGAAPTSYRIDVTGAYVGSVPTTSRAVSGTVSAGTYTLSVAAVNGCGSSATTTTQTIVIS